MGMGFEQGMMGFFQNIRAGKLGLIPPPPPPPPPPATSESFTKHYRAADGGQPTVTRGRFILTIVNRIDGLETH
jgi:hypothetical protein